MLNLACRPISRRCIRRQSRQATGLSASSQTRRLENSTYDATAPITEFHSDAFNSADAMERFTLGHEACGGM